MSPARRLFARVLDAPGGINILTIHAFCQSLLRRFPLEAGVAPDFDVLDEAEAQTLLRDAQDEQMEALAAPRRASRPGRSAGRGRRPDLDRRIRRADDQACWANAAWLLAPHRRRSRHCAAVRRGWPRRSAARRRHRRRPAEQRLPRRGLRYRRPARRRTSAGQGRQADVARAALIADWLAAADRPTGAAGRLCQGIPHRQGRDPRAAWSPRPRSRRCPASKACCAARPSDWPSARRAQRRGAGRAHHRAAAARPRHRWPLRRAPSGGAPRSTTTT